LSKLNLWRGCVNAVRIFQKIFFSRLGQMKSPATTGLEGDGSVPATLKTKTSMESHATLKHFADDIRRLQVLTGGQNNKPQFFATCPSARRQPAIGIMAGSLPHFSACARRAAVQEPP